MSQGSMVSVEEAFRDTTIPGKTYFSGTIPEPGPLTAMLGALGRYVDALEALGADKMRGEGGQGNFKSLEGRHEKEKRVCKIRDALFQKLKKLGQLHYPARYVRK